MMHEGEVYPNCVRGQNPLKHQPPNDKATKWEVQEQLPGGGGSLGPSTKCNKGIWWHVLEPQNRAHTSWILCLKLNSNMNHQHQVSRQRSLETYENRGPNLSFSTLRLILIMFSILEISQTTSHLVCKLVTLYAQKLCALKCMRGTWIVQSRISSEYFIIKVPTLELSVKSLKEGWNRGFDPSLRELLLKVC